LVALVRLTARWLSFSNGKILSVKAETQADVALGVAVSSQAALG